MKIFSENKKNTKGFLLVEVLIAASIIAISVLAATSVAQKSIAMASRTLHTTQAAYLIEDAAELTRIIRDGDWNSISGLTIGQEYHPSYSTSWGFASGTETIDRFTRSVVFSQVCRNSSSGDIEDCPGGGVDSGTLLITVSVSWDEAGEVVTKEISFYLADLFS